MPTKSHIQLVTISARQNDAASIESFMRDRGQPVRMKWLQPNDDLEKGLSAAAPDLIYCEGDDEKRRDFALHCCLKAAPEKPILILATDINAEQVSKALQKRARDLVCAKHMEHLQGVTLRELAASNLERQLREARSELTAVRARLNSLVSVSQLSVANIQEGILVEVSEDFLQLFGYESVEQLQSRPFLELIDASEQARVKKLISQRLRGKGQDEEIETLGRMAKGDNFALLLRMAAVESDEGAGLEIQARAVDVPVPVAAPETAEVVAAPRDEAKHIEPAHAAPSEPAAATDEGGLADLAEKRASKRLRDALERKRYSLGSKPVITLDGQNSDCSEILLTLRDERDKLIEFGAEFSADSTVSNDCQRLLIDEAATLLAKRQSEQDFGKVLITVMPSCLEQVEEFQLHIETQLKPAIDAGHELILNFPERGFIHKLAECSAWADRLRKMGAQIAIDGSRGNATSVQMMEELQPQYLCLDRAATQLLVSQGSEHPELSKIIAFSHSDNMKIIAHPLQDAHSMAMLWQRGVNLVRSANLLEAA